MSILYRFALNIGYYGIKIFSFVQIKINQYIGQNLTVKCAYLYNHSNQSFTEMEYSYKNRIFKITGINSVDMNLYINSQIDNNDNTNNSKIPSYKWISAEIVDGNLHNDSILSIIKTYAGPYGDFYAHCPSIIQTVPSILQNTKVILMDYKLNSYTIDYSQSYENYYTQFHILYRSAMESNLANS